MSMLARVCVYVYVPACLWEVAQGKSRPSTVPIKSRKKPCCHDELQLSPQPRAGSREALARSAYPETERLELDTSHREARHVELLRNCVSR